MSVVTATESVGNGTGLEQHLPLKTPHSNIQHFTFCTSILVGVMFCFLHLQIFDNINVLVFYKI